MTFVRINLCRIGEVADIAFWRIEFRSRKFITTTLLQVAYILDYMSDYTNSLIHDTLPLLVTITLEDLTADTKTTHMVTGNIAQSRYIQ